MEGKIIAVYKARYQRRWSNFAWTGLFLMLGGLALGFSLYAYIGRNFYRYHSIGILYLPTFFIVIGFIGLALLLYSLYKKGQFNQSLFIRSVVSQARWREIKVSQAYREIDSDIQSNGKQAGKLWIGSEWIVADQVVYLPRVLRILSSGSLGPDYLTLTLTDGETMFFSAGTEKEAKAALEYLREIVPHLCER